MRQADLRRKAAAAMAAKPASALLYDTVMWYLVWVCALRWDERYDGFKYTFSTDFFDWQIPSKKLSMSRKRSFSIV